MRKSHSKVKAVIFDMDGVITNTMPDHYKAWKKIFAENGVSVGRLDVYKREGQKGLSSVLEIFAERGKKMTRAKAKKILKQKEILFKKIVKTRFITGARGFVRKLRAEGFQLSLVTGTSRHEVREILPSHVFNLFDVIVTGSDVRHGKPHPEPYLKALKKLKLKARDAVVIENAPFGITSARRAGLKCFALATSLPKEYLKDAAKIFSSFRHMQSKVSFILNENEGFILRG